MSKGVRNHCSTLLPAQGTGNYAPEVGVGGVVQRPGYAHNEQLCSQHAAVAADYNDVHVTAAFWH